MDGRQFDLINQATIEICLIPQGYAKIRGLRLVPDCYEKVKLETQCYNQQDFVGVEIS